MPTTSRSADLCWGQRYIWLRHHQLPEQARHESHLVSISDLPPGAQLPGVRAMLTYLIRRHEALRTTYHLDRSGNPRQCVHPPAGIPVTVVSVERDGTDSPAQVIDRLSHTAFDLAAEWPIRACVITAGDAPRQLVLVLNHIAFDAWTFERFERELKAVGAGVSAGRPVSLKPNRYQPVDLAQHESAPGAVAAKDRALAFWRDEIARLPADPFAARRRRDDGRPPYAATLTSPALTAVGRDLAQRHQVWPSLIHLAAHNMVLAAYTGAAEVTHLYFSGNRDAGAFAEVMTCMFSPLLLRLDLSGNPTFREVLARTAGRFEQAREHRAAPYDELLGLLGRESFRRGAAVRVGAEFNYLSNADVDSRARRTRLTWTTPPTAWGDYDGDTYLRVHELRDAVAVSLHAAATVLDSEAVERFLRGYEQVLLVHADPAVDLALDDVAELIGFAAPPQRDDDLDAITAVPSEQIVAEGDGRKGDGRAQLPVEPAGEAERALVAAVAQANGLARVSVADAYPSAGGQVLRIPYVLAVLAERGYTGLSLHDLAGGSPLRALAGRLIRTDD